MRLPESLKFRPEDFCEKTDENKVACPHGDGNDWCAGRWYAEKANAVLAERLGEMLGITPIDRGLEDGN